MTEERNKDAGLKRAIVELLKKCDLNEIVADREVHFNFTGAKDSSGKYIDEKETDVVASFSYAGKKVLLLFECEDSVGPSGSIRAEYRDYARVMETIQNSANVHVLHSKDEAIRDRDLTDADEIHLCFVYGPRYPESKLKTCLQEADRYSSISVWDSSSLRYFLAISSTLGGWTKYELFKEFDLDLEPEATFTIPALEIKQKMTTMYLGTIHPGQLLKIAYVTRRAKRSTYAYQRMLSGHRIKDIARFISSDAPEAFLPNAVIVVFDHDPAIQRSIHYESDRRQLTIPRKYCSAWIIDGQHRVYGFVGTRFENWSDERHHRFDLPVVIFKTLDEMTQTKSFITINYNQKKIKSGLLCDLSTVTGDMDQRLTWASAIGKGLNDLEVSPLYNKVQVTELDSGRPISLSSLVQYGILQSLLGFKPGPTFSGPFAKYAPISVGATFHSIENQDALRKQIRLLIYFLKSVRKNTGSKLPAKDPWTNTRQYSLLKPTGLNALFLVLTRILEKHPRGTNFADYLAPLRTVRFSHTVVAKVGGGWGGFRELANKILRKLNAVHHEELVLYGQKKK